MYVCMYACNGVLIPDVLLTTYLLYVCMYMGPF